MQKNNSFLLYFCLLIGIISWIQFLKQDYSWPIVIIWFLNIIFFLKLKIKPIKKNKIYRKELISISLILILGIFFRLYKLNTIPFGLNHDASYSGLMAIKILQSKNYIPWSLDAAAGETLFDYIIAGFIVFIGHTPLAIKAASSLVGILTLIGMYFFSKQLLGKKSAFLSTFLVAISGWHIIFSRVGWRVILLPLFETITFYFLLKALKKHNKNFYIGIGISLAILLNTYLAARILPLMIMFWLVIELIFNKKKLILLKEYSQIVLPFLLVGAPILAFFITNSTAANSRSNSLSILPEILSGNLKPLIHNLQVTANIFTVRANGDDFFVNQPLLDNPVKFLFLIGLFFVIWKVFKEPRKYGFIILGFLITLLPGLFSVNPNGNRIMGSLPFVYLIASLPLVACLNFKDKIKNKTLKLFPLAVVLFFLIFSVYNTWNQYFSKNRKEIWGLYPETTIVGNYINQLDNRYNVYLTDNYPRDALTYITYKSNDPLINLNSPGYPYQAHYKWFNNGDQFLEKNNIETNKGIAFLMFADNPYNKKVQQQLLKNYSNAVMFYLIYVNDNIKRVSSRVILVPPTGDNVANDIPINANLNINN